MFDAALPTGRKIENACCTMRVYMAHLRVPHDQITSRGVPASALLDTGAQVSAIAPDLAVRLSLRVIDYRPLIGSTGEEIVPVVVATLGLPHDKGVFAKPLELYVTETTHPLILGMDAMYGSVLNVDCVNGKWTWSVWRPKKSPQTS